MAIVRLAQPVEWGYDTVTHQLVVRMQERPPADSSDPASWEPTREALAWIPVATAQMRDIAGGAPVTGSPQ